MSMNNTSKMIQDWLKSTRGLLKPLTHKHTAYVLQYLLGECFKVFLFYLCIISLWKNCAILHTFGFGLVIYDYKMKHLTWTKNK